MADGGTLVASEQENPDLFWALRGGGGNFGVVTSFEFDLYPLGPNVLAGMVVWPMDDAPAVLGLLRDLASEGPDELCLLGNLRLAPPLPAIPADLHGKPIAALVVCYAGPIDEGEDVLRPIRGFGNPVVDTVMPKPYVAHQQMFDAAVPRGRDYYWKSHKLPALTDPMIDVIVEHASKITSPMSTVPIFTQGGAVGRVPDDATAFANRDAAHDINVVASWMPEDPEPDRHIAWVRDFYAALEPYSAGMYVNFTMDESDEWIREAAYGAERWRRLVDIKGRYDPTNFFHRNANIPPS
jgi:FAD/FMN-containing dehydrogenase